MSYQIVFKPGFLDRAKNMSGLKTDSAFAGALGVSESALSKARKSGVATPALIVGLYAAFGFTPGEITTIGFSGELKNESLSDQAVAA